MFNGTSDIIIKTDKPKNEVLTVIHENLEAVRATEISEKGQIKIDAKRFSSFAHGSTIEGSFKEKDGKYIRWIQVINATFNFTNFLNFINFINFINFLNFINF